MPSQKADRNSPRNSARAARSSLMTRSFPAGPFRSAADGLAEPIADAAEYQDIDRKHGPAQQGQLGLERRALLGAARGLPLEKAALDRADQRPIDEGRD